MFLEQEHGSGVGGRRRVVVGNEVAQMAVFLLTDGRFQRNGFLRHTQNFADFVNGHLELGGDFFGGRVPSVFMEKLAVCLFDFVDGLHHMHGDSNGAGLVGDGSGDGLPDPPGGVSGELKTFCVVELVNRFDEPEVPLLNQIEELHSPADITLGDADNEAQVRLGEPLFGPHIVLRYPNREFDFLLGCQKGHPADFLEVNLDGVIHGRVFLNARHIRRFRDFQIKRQTLQSGVAEVIDNLYALAFNDIIQLIKFLDIVIHLHNDGVDFLRGQPAVEPAFFQ